MSGKITFKVPARDGTVLERSGRIAVLKVGDKPYRFVLQDSTRGRGVAVLTHYASGLIVGSLDRARMRANEMRLGNRARLSPRAAAEYVLAYAIERHGIDKVRASIDGARVINPD